MASQAKLTSTDALETFRASLIVFLNKAHSSLDQATDEIRRTRSWIQHEQRTHWEAEARRRAQALAQAEQELLSARMTKSRDNLSLQQLAVRRAKESLEEAHDKIRKVKAWLRVFDETLEPMARRLNSLRAYLDHDLPQGIAYLAAMGRIVDSYTEMPGAAGAAPAPIPSEAASPTEPLL